jgi:hypothetical protein
MDKKEIIAAFENAATTYFCGTQDNIGMIFIGRNYQVKMYYFCLNEIAIMPNNFYLCWITDNPQTVLIKDRAHLENILQEMEIA